MNRIDFVAGLTTAEQTHATATFTTAPASKKIRMVSKGRLTAER